MKKYIYQVTALGDYGQNEVRQVTVKAQGKAQAEKAAIQEMVKRMRMEADDYQLRCLKVK